MENESHIYLPTLTEDEFVENIESDDFLRRFGNPVIVRTKAAGSFIVMSIELYDRMTKLCGFPGSEETIQNESRT